MSSIAAITDKGFEITPLEKLSKDIKAAAKNLGPRQARYLVDSYYMMQKNRMRALRQAATLKDFGEPNALVEWLGVQNEALEKNLKSALGVYSQSSRIGQWAESICGIGPVISAGLLANIDMKKAPTVGHIWRFAGLDPTVRWIGSDKLKKVINSVWEDVGYVDTDEGEEPDWPIFLNNLSTALELPLEYIQRRGHQGEKGETLDKATKSTYIAGLARRPWNASLKRLCWIIGESFVKVSTNKNDYYGKVWRQRSEMETINNEKLMYKDQAERTLREKNIGKETDAYKAYVQGKLPKARIHERAKRYAVKLFLSHWHWVAYEITFNAKPPKPYVIEHLGHTDLLTPPNWTSIV